MTDDVKISAADGVLEILWNRPDKKNALSQAMYGAAANALDRASADASIRCVLLGSEGETFTAGNDIGDFAKANTGHGGPRESSRFIRTIAAFEKPVVGAAPGLAIGVGLTMLLHCDMVFVADTAKLSAPFASLGLVPEAASSITLPARIGHPRAFAVFALGEAILGTEAARIGLANASMPSSEVLSAGRAMARRLAKQPLGAVMATKKLLRDTAGYAQRIEEEMKVFGERLMSAEAREAFAAFAEKRAPDFSKV